MSVRLNPDFVERLEHTLSEADQLRRKRVWLRRLRRAVPLVLLAGPVLAWRLMLASPDGVHVGISALAWVMFLLDVAVHTDGELLSYLGLTALPTALGVLLLILLGASLLWRPGDRP